MAAANKYVKGKKLGEGTWGVVYEGTSKVDGQLVAIKRIKTMQGSDISTQGLNFSALREIKYLKEIDHPNIVDLLDAYLSDGALHLVFEYCISDLEQIIKTKSIFFTPGDIKSYMSMLLQALEHCHKFCILHRDLKPGNVLVSSSGAIKLTDFGLARFHGSPNRRLTSTVVTSWYRCPEVLYGANYYSGGVDIWAAGCMLAELILRAPLFQGDSDSNIVQLKLIFNFFGTPVDSPSPDEDTSSSLGYVHSVHWPGVSLLPQYLPFESRDPPRDYAYLFSSQSPDLLELFEKCMMFDPAQRVSASQALALPYFGPHSHPQATPPHDLPKPNAGVDAGGVSRQFSPPNKRMRTSEW